MIRLLVLVLLAALAGCGSDDGANPIGPGLGSPSSPFTGTFLSGHESGLLSVSIAGAALAPALRAPGAVDTVVTAFGVMSLDGGEVVNLTGTYDTGTDSLDLAGQAWVLRGALDSTVIPPGIVGDYSGPTGAGRFACRSGGTGSVKVFCGRFESGTTAAAGLWGFLIMDGTLSGFMALDAAPSVAAFTGTVAGAGVNRTLTIANPPGEPTLAGSGTWNTSTDEVTGTWASSGDSGSWSGERCLAGGAGPD